MSCLLSCNGVVRPTSIRKLARSLRMPGPNGSGEVCLNNLMTRLGPLPRPFYVVGHNPNSIDDVRAALAAGANAIEPDVNVYELDKGRLCISEVAAALTKLGGLPWAPSLESYLEELHDVALANPQLALVVFDCKPLAARDAHGVTLLNEIRKRLTHDTKLNVIISVAARSNAGMFNSIRGALGPREGLMVDSENDPEMVSTSVLAGVNNQCYGNGIAAVVQTPVLAPHVRPSIEHACALRASAGNLKFIYTWSVADAETMREYIRIGVDGIIAGMRPAKFDAASVAVLRRVVGEAEFQARIRLATRKDDPFKQPNAAYSLSVLTADDGTDANVTFTLNGKFGSCRMTVDTLLNGRMEANEWNYVTVPSQNLGELESLTVSRDNHGNRPDWYLERVLVESSRYAVSKTAEFNRSFDTINPYTQALV